MGQARDVALRTATAVSGVVGDGCVVSVYERSSDSLRPVAVAHRDRERREALFPLLVREPVGAGVSWLGEALGKNISFRLRHAAAAEAAGAIGAAPIHAAIAAPLRIGGRPSGVVLALRDSADIPYTPNELRLVEQIAAGVRLPAPMDGPGAGIGGEPAIPPAALRMLEHAPAGLWVTDLGGRTLYVNHAACELAGAPSHALLGTPVAGFLDPGAERAAASTAPEPMARDELLQRVDGDELWVSVTQAPLTDDHGQRIGTVRALHEVGERRRIEIEARLRAAGHAVVAEIAEAALAGEAFQVLAEQAVAALADLLAADCAALCDVDPERCQVTPRALLGWPRAMLGQGRALPVQSPERACLDEYGPVVVRDFDAIDGLECAYALAGAAPRSAICMAVADGAGILSVHSATPGAFSAQDLSFLCLLGGILSWRWPSKVHEMAVR